MTVTEWAQIERIVAMTGPERDRLVEAFLACPAHRRLFRVIAVGLCRRYRMDIDQYGDDVTSEVTIVALQMLTVPQMAARARNHHSWAGALALFAQNVVKAMSESPGVVGSPGMSTRVRRARGLGRMRERLSAETGGEPSTQAVVEAYNRQMAATRKDAARQGMLATVADTVPVAPVELDPTLELASIGHDTDCPLMPVEARELIRLVLGRCEALGQTLGNVARAVYGRAIDGDPPYIATVAEAAQITGLSAQTVRRTCREVEVLMRQVLADEFGIVSVHG